METLMFSALLLSGAAHAQDAMFPFPLSHREGAKTLSDVSFLNDKPAGAGGHIVARNGHFVESQSRRRVRFVGINLTFGTVFLPREDATALAARLAKFGFNVVRLHYYDQSAYSPATIWDKNSGNFRKLDAEKLDRLDFLVSELKKRGIYTNINLHVARTFTEKDGLPPSVKEIPYGFHKRVSYFNARMIELQREFARDLLTHKNPYTGNAYVSEPAILCVELTNEDSLAWFDGGADLINLPEPFLGELRGLWSAWLKAKYGDETRLRAAWNGGSAALGEELLRDANNAKSWQIEKQNPTFEWAQNGDVLTANLQNATGQDWHAQVHQTGLNLESGKTYTLRFMARAPQPRPFNVSAQLNQPDWRMLGLRRTINLTPEWKAFSFTFAAQNTVPNQARLSLQFGEANGVVELKNISLRPGAAPVEFPTGALQNNALPLMPDAFGQARFDWLEFLLATERSYAVGFKNYLQKELGLRSLVACSQVNYGGLVGLYRENEMDYIDNHAYWDHPGSPEGWNLNRLTYSDKPMTPELGKNDTLTNMALWRVAGKPYVVSEYLHPYPNSYGSETVPLLATFAARQDWDAIYLHEYGISAENGPDYNSAVRQPFMVSGNPGWMCFWPAMAVAFRTQLVDVAPHAQIEVPSQADGAFLAKGIRDVWKDAPFIFSRRLALSFPGVQSAKEDPKGDNTKLQLQNNVFTADAPGVKTITGNAANKEIAVGDAKFAFGATSHNHAVLTLGALDGKPLSQSNRALLTVVAKVQNTGFQWDAEHRRAANWGTAPVLIEVPRVAVTLPVDGPRKVWALDVTGAPQSEIKTEWQNGTLRFAIGPENKSLWFAVVK
jgi:hypothetical protein